MNKNKVFIIGLLCLLNVIISVNFIVLDIVYLLAYLLIKYFKDGTGFEILINSYLVLFFIGCVIEVWLRLWKI